MHWAVQILESVGEGLAAIGIHHILHGDFFSCLVTDGSHIGSIDLILGFVLCHQSIDFILGNFVHDLDQITHGPGIHLPAQLGLDFHLVALGNSHFPHIVAEAHDLQIPGHSHANGGLHPAADAVQDLGILPVACDDLPGHPQPSSNEAMLPVTMGGLVQIHEIHVDLVVGDLLVVLGSKVAVRLLQVCQTVDPHFRGRESVAPGDVGTYTTDESAPQGYYTLFAFILQEGSPKATEIHKSFPDTV